ERRGEIAVEGEAEVPRRRHTGVEVEPVETVDVRVRVLRSADREPVVHAHAREWRSGRLVDDAKEESVRPRGQLGWSARQDVRRRYDGGLEDDGRRGRGWRVVLLVLRT